MTCYKCECSHWLKLQHSDWRANLVKDFFEINFPPMRALKFITGNVIYNPAYMYLQIPTENIGSKLVQNGSNLIILDFSRITKIAFCLQNVCQRIGSAPLVGILLICYKYRLTQDLSDQ